jgi:hypothetical protein
MKFVDLDVAIDFKDVWFSKSFGIAYKLSLNLVFFASPKKKNQ